jgi:hypothetical protein
MNDEVKKPERDQYWEHEKSGERVYFIGKTPEGEMVWQCNGDPIGAGNIDWSDWKHLPDCTGWRWQPETFPQWWTTRQGDSDNEVAFVTAEKDKSWRLHYKHGGEYLFTINRFSPIGRTQITKEQAEALLNKPTPVESDPEEWVEINKIQFGDMIPRSGVDVLLRDCDSNDCANDRSFITEGAFHIGHSTWNKWKFVCRRCDLPKVEPKTKRVAVRLYWYDGNIVGRYDHSQPTDQSFQEIKSDGNGGWFVEGCV